MKPEGQKQIRRGREEREETEGISEGGKREKEENEEPREKKKRTLMTLQCLLVSMVFCSHYLSVAGLFCPCVSHSLSRKFSLYFSISLALP